MIRGQNISAIVLILTGLKLVAAQNDLCAGKLVGIFPYPDRCDKFVVCILFIPVVVLCPEDTFFDHEVSNCVKGDPVTCQPWATTENPLETTDSTIFTETPTEPESTIVTEAPTIPESTTVTEAPTIPESTIVTEAPTEPESTIVTEAPTEPESTIVTEAPTESESTIVTEAPTEPESTIVTEAPTEPESTIVTEVPTESETQQL